MSQIVCIELATTEISMALQDKLDAFNTDFEAGRLAFKPTKNRLEAMHRATAELIASGQAQRAKKAGDVAPEFVLNDPDGKPVSSRELLANGSLVVSFYRGVWCPYCNLELQALQAALPEISGAARACWRSRRRLLPTAAIRNATTSSATRS
jgi:hypothetical protein